MRCRSLRTRLAVTSALLSALVLVSFAVPTWVLMYRLSLKRLDLLLEEGGGLQLFWLHSPAPWRDPSAFLDPPQNSDKKQSFVLHVRDGEGKTVYRSPDWPKAIGLRELPTLSLSEGPPQGEAGPPSNFGPPPPPAAKFVTRRVGTVQWRIAVLGSPWLTLAIGARVASFSEEMSGLRNAFLMALPAALLLLGLSGWALSERALRPVRELADAVAGITAKGLHWRLPAGEEDVEFQRLTTAFNDMLDRLGRSFHQAIRFSADAAHELKTPLTVLQGELEVAVQAAPDGSEQQQTYGALLEEVQRLKSIVQKLLLLSRADAGQLALNLAPVNLSQAAETLCDDLEIMAPHLTVKKDIASDVWVSADDQLLNQALSNLISNAVKYNRDEGLLGVGLTQDDSLATFSVFNTGPEIASEDRERIFDRFYRADQARTRQDDGVGLGLSIAREIAWAHHGDLALLDPDDGLTTFSLTLPLSERAQQQA